MLGVRLDIIGGFFDAQASQAIFILMLAGIAMAVIGLFLLFLPMTYRLKGQAVSLRVIELHNDKYEPKLDDSAEKIALEAANPLKRLEFEILEGPNVGLKVMSFSASNKPAHEIGEVVRGYYIEKSGEIASKAELKNGTLFGTICLVIGICFIVLPRI